MSQFAESWQPVLEHLTQIDKKVDGLLLQMKENSTSEELKNLNEFSRVIKISIKEIQRIVQGIPFEAYQLKLLLEMAESLEKKIEANIIPGGHLLPEYRREKSKALSSFDSVYCSVKLMRRIICEPQ